MMITKLKLREIIKELIREFIKEDKGPCWDGYKQVGMKDKGGKQVPNCVPISEILKLKEGDTEYQSYFRKELEKTGKSSPAEMSDDEKREFFSKIDSGWKGKNEGNAFGAAVVKAKKAGKDEFSVDGKKFSVKEEKSKYKKLNIEERLQLFLEKNIPNDPQKWSYAKTQAKSKFDVYPSAYANGWASKKYKELGGTWKKSTSENVDTLKNLSSSHFKVKEALSVDPKRVYGGTGAKEGMVLIAKTGLDKILDLSKKNPSNVFLVSDDNYTKFGPYYVKNGKVAKYTVANPNYDFEKNKVSNLKIKSDVILKFKIVNEGNAFGMAVTKAKEEGKDEFEFNGKTYRVKNSKKESKLGGWGTEVESGQRITQEGGWGTEIKTENKK